MRHVGDPEAFARWLAQPELERDPFLIPLDRSQLPRKLEGDELRAWLARVVAGETEEEEVF